MITQRIVCEYVWDWKQGQHNNKRGRKKDNCREATHHCAALLVWDNANPLAIL